MSSIKRLPARAAAVIAAVILVGGGLAACGSSGSGSGGSSGGGGTPHAVIALGGAATILLPVYIADVEGYYSKEGVDVTLQDVGPLSTTEVVGGKADLAGIGLTASFSPVPQGKDMQIVVATSKDSTSGVALPSVKSWADCKNVATSAAGTATYIFAKYMEQRLHVSYRITPIQDPSDIIPTVVSGHSDCGMNAYSSVQPFVAAHKVNLLLDPRNPSTFPSGTSLEVGYGLFGVKQALDARRPVIVKIMSALKLAFAHIASTSPQQLASELRRRSDWRLFPEAELVPQLAAEKKFFTSPNGEISAAEWGPYIQKVSLGLPIVKPGQPEWSYNARVDMSFLNAAK